MKFISRFSEYGMTISSSESYVERGRTVSKPGKHIRFHNNQYSTTDQKEIAWLKNHPGFGTDFFAVKEDAIDKIAIVKKQLKSDDIKTR